MFKKLLSIALMSCMMVTSMCTFAYANQITSDVFNDKNIVATQLSEKELLINENGLKSTIIVEETKTGSTVTINNLTTGESEYFIRNESNNTLYSSITGKTIELSNSMLRSSEYISYNELGNMVGYGAAAAEIVGALVAYTGFTAVTVLVNTVAKLLDVISFGLSSQPTNSGLIITIESVRMVKWQGGAQIVYYVDKITDVETY